MGANRPPHPLFVPPDFVHLVVVTTAVRDGNFVKIAMFDDPRYPKKEMHGQPMNTRKLFIVANRNRSAPEGLKFNLHVDVLQTLFGQPNSTAIIIDPDGGNQPQPPFGDPD